MKNKIFLHGALLLAFASQSFAQEITSVGVVVPEVPDTSSVLRPAEGELIYDSSVSDVKAFVSGNWESITQGSASSPKFAVIKDVKSSGTGGGTCTSGSFQSRILNLLEGDTSFISIDTEGGTKTVGTNGTARRFILQAGTYVIEADAPGALVGNHQAILRNISDSSDAIIGGSSFAHSATSMQTVSVMKGVITVSSAKTFEIQHRCGATRATDGFGFSTSFGTNEVYTQVKITKTQ